ncbi:DUF1223 domain-containing protein [Polymorphum gilvum]|uniref:Secreted protein n=1 Tax=Polymorphum gilvum (strain LMG 25793 / CGMCC 1.9160 / SL003B-26A1) TaxID=991905 RepID=F2J139_POLGS|nr:DUF1223 domain-containing protein [Polymorphum gilvum]ADZ68685.1 hypothetical protein SL003B_0247 [Polymorphum gilvum SL003B-26A1]
MGMLRKALCAFFLGLSAAFYAAPAAAADARVVVELFTSQGCSSCPPADRLLAELAVEEGVLALSLPVDYWDYLGWKDTLASPDNSDRQRQYAVRRGDRAVYTPQMVINGGEHVTGNDAAAVRAAISRARPLPAKVKLASTDQAIEVTLDGQLPDGAAMATVFLLQVKERETVEIGRGENTGREITYVNVVRKVLPMGMWSGGTQTFRMPRHELKKSKGERCAVLVQLDDGSGPGAVVGAASMTWEKSR